MANRNNFSKEDWVLRFMGWLAISQNDSDLISICENCESILRNLRQLTPENMDVFCLKQVTALIKKYEALKAKTKRQIETVKRCLE